jgi:TRAP-type C4-dicarboxylate transport system substrate-binding protein
MNPYSIFHHTIINESWRLSLPDDTRAIFDECMEEYQEWIRNETAQYEFDSIEFLKEQGMEVLELTPEQKEAFKAVAVPVRDKMSNIVGDDFYQRTLEFMKKN